MTVARCAPAGRSMLKSMESDERYVVVRLCIAGRIEYLGRVATLADFDEYRKCCGFDKADIQVQDWKPEADTKKTEQALAA